MRSNGSYESIGLWSFRDHWDLYIFHLLIFLVYRIDSNKPFYCVYLQTGLFHLPHGDFFIEPVKEHPRAEGEHHPHVIYRRRREEPACGLKGTAAQNPPLVGELVLFSYRSIPTRAVPIKSVISSPLGCRNLCTLVYITSALCRPLYSCQEGEKAIAASLLVPLPCHLLQSDTSWAGLCIVSFVHTPLIK